MVLKAQGPFSSSFCKNLENMFLLAPEFFLYCQSGTPQKLFTQNKSRILWNAGAGRDLRGPRVQPSHFSDEDIEVLLVRGMMIKWLCDLSKLV